MDRCKKCGSTHSNVKFVDKGKTIKLEDISNCSVNSPLIRKDGNSSFFSVVKELLHVTCALCGYSYVREPLDAPDVYLEERAQKPGVGVDENCLEGVFNVDL